MNRGLVVPVLRDCDRMSFADVEKTLVTLSQRARKDEITMEEMTGGNEPTPLWISPNPIASVLCNI